MRISTAQPERNVPESVAGGAPRRILVSTICKWFAAAGLVSATFVCFGSVGTHVLTDSVAAVPPLWIDPDMLTTPVLAADGLIEYSLPIHNTGTDEVVVNGIRASCNCASVAPDSFRLMSGERLMLTISVHTDRWHAQPDDTGISRVQVYLTPILARGTSRPEWRLTCQYRSREPILSSPVFMGVLVAGTGEKLRKQVTLPLNASLSDVKLVCVPPLISAVVTEELTDGLGIVVETASQVMEPGTYEGYVNLSATGQKNETVEYAAFPYRLRVENDVFAVVDQSEVLHQVHSTDSYRKIHLKSRSGKAFFARPHRASHDCVMLTSVVAPTAATEFTFCLKCPTEISAAHRLIRTHFDIEEVDSGRVYPIRTQFYIIESEHSRHEKAGHGH